MLSLMTHWLVHSYPIVHERIKKMRGGEEHVTSNILKPAQTPGVASKN